MRVTGGEARGVPLASPRAPGVRPTMDRVRVALFNILAARGIEGAIVVDLYAGTGSLGIEALSRGAAQADFVEADRRQMDVIQANVQATNVADRATLIHATVERALEGLDRRYDLVLMDPPYTQPFPAGVVARTAELGLLAEDAVVVVGHASRVEAPAVCGRLVRDQDRRYGDSSLAFYSVHGDDA
ncbi:MAG: 16S rRNA (guanine(966)-N(2))-methyltransferase RsmD [Chloroflexi bacterium]|nr:16S rRNA (guanine(966)-N(2))-methyltransferase RsmD [Chloroflexota bacterium]